MSKGKNGSYLHRLQRWWHSPLGRVALVLGIGVHLAGFLLFRVVSEPAEAHEQPRPFIIWNGPEQQDESMIRLEQWLLLDSEALFLPTALNARGENDALRMLSPGAALLETELNLPVTANLPLSAEGAGQEPLSAEGLLARYARDGVTTYGQSKPPRPAETSGRVARVEVRDASTGRVVGEFTLDTGESILPVPSEPEALEYILYRAGAGNIGSLLPLSSAAGGEAGKAWARQIERAEWEGSLPQGYYRIIVSP